MGQHYCKFIIKFSGLLSDVLYKSEGVATVETLPNHSYFDPLSHKHHLHPQDGVTKDDITVNTLLDILSQATAVLTNPVVPQSFPM
jgi:hypothetical protein